MNKRSVGRAATTTISFRLPFSSFFSFSYVVYDLENKDDHCSNLVLENKTGKGEKKKQVNCDFFNILTVWFFSSLLGVIFDIVQKVVAWEEEKFSTFFLPPITFALREKVVFFFFFSHFPRGAFFRIDTV